MYKISKPQTHATKTKLKRRPKPKRKSIKKDDDYGKSTANELNTIIAEHL